MTPRQPDWDVDKARGEEAEALYRKIRSMILSGTAEVKRDDRASQTGNFYIEWQCRSQGGEWHLSGIATTRAHVWVIVAWPITVSISTWVLRNLARDAWRDGDRAECVVGSNPTKGVLIPVGELLPRALAFTTSPIAEAA